MAPITFKLPNFDETTTSSKTILVTGRETSPQISRRASKVPPTSHLKPAPQDDRKLSMSPALLRRSESLFSSSKLKICLITLVTLSIALVALLVAVKLTSHHKVQVSKHTDSTTTSSNTNPKVYQPSPATTFQIDLSTPLNDTSAAVDVYIIDLFSNPSTTIAALQAQNKKVICHFSAGTFDLSVPDRAQFSPTVLGTTVAASNSSSVTVVPGEKWIDTRSSAVRALMRARLDLAVQKGCDGVDPSETDSYLSDSGFSLSRRTALDYIQFLALAAHARDLAIGLRDTGALVEEVVGEVEWSLNIGCEKRKDCALYWPFTEAGKAVWHVVVVVGDGDGTGTAVVGEGDADLDKGGISEVEKKEFWCAGSNTEGFMSVLKRAGMGAWRDAC